MSDRELLEMAAKAAGIEWENVLRDDGVFVEKGREWSPLTDDGDALRLAVRLHLDLRFHWDGCHDQYDEIEAYTHGAGRDASEQIGIDNRGYQIDELNATRRAIVRAAAKIGRAME